MIGTPRTSPARAVAGGAAPAWPRHWVDVKSGLSQSACAVRGRSSLFIGIDAESGAPGDDDRLSTGGGAELGQDVRHVIAYGFEAEHKVIGDVGVAVPGGEEGKDLALPEGQLGERDALRTVRPRHQHRW